MGLFDICNFCLGKIGKNNHGRIFYEDSYMGASKNRGIPKWMVYFMENPMNKWMIWGVNTPIFGLTPISTGMSCW